jgi:hypothetical protein
LIREPVTVHFESLPEHKIRRVLMHRHGNSG